METIDEQVAEFMTGWHIGAMPYDNGDALVEHHRFENRWTEAMERGYVVARVFCAKARNEERARLMWNDRYGENSLTQEEGLMVQGDNVIGAVKAYRLRTNVPLKEALDIVRAWKARKAIGG
jgi:hypothetical protein